MGRIDFDNQTEPPLPNTDRTALYVDSVDKHIKTKDDNGVIVDLTESATTIRFDMINNTGVTISKGSPVHFASFDNPNDEPEMVLADADDPTKMPAVGILELDTLNGAVGFVTFLGSLSGIDTSSFAEGDLLYVGKTPGTLVNSRPTGGSTAIQPIATVGKIDASLGFIAVHGALQVNSLPNITTGKFLVGDSDGFPVEQTAPTLMDPDTNPITGIISGGLLSINGGDNTKFDLTAGTARVADYSNPLVPVITEVSWTAFTAEAVPNITGDDFTSIAISVAGALVTLGDATFTPQQRREQINIGAITHVGITLEDVTTTPTPVYNTIHAMIDYINANGGIVNGSKIQTTNANLTFAQAAGTFTLPFVNYANNILSPSTVTNAASDPADFNQSFQDGLGEFTVQVSTTTINPDNYDDGTGVLATVPNNNWTFQPVFYLGQFDRLIIQYGQFLYNNKTNAIQGISEDFDEMVISPDLEEAAVLLGWFVMQEGATDLSDGAQADFIGIGRGAGGGSAGATTYDQLTDTPATKVSDNIVLSNNAANALIYDTSENVNSLGHAEPAVTGILTGGEVTSFSVTQVSVAAGTGEIVDFYTDYKAPVRTPVTWSGSTLTIPDLGVDSTTYIYIDSSGVIQTQAGFPNAVDIRTKIFLAATINNINISEVIAILQIPAVVGNTTTTFIDYMNFIGLTRDKGRIAQTGDTGTNGTLALSVGETTMFFPNINWQTSKSNPNRLTFGAQDPVVWSYALQTGDLVSENNTLIDPTQFDDGGVLTSVPTAAGGKRTTIQYIYKLLNGDFFVLFGQTVYDDLATAQLSLGDDLVALIVPSVLETFGTPFAAILVSQNATDLADTTTSDIIQLGTLNGSGSGGGSGASTFLSLTDTPSSYTGEAGKVGVVNPGETALEFTTISAMAFPEFQFFADQLNSPVNTDFVVNALAPTAADSNNAALTVRLFDDTAEEAVDFRLIIPSGATNMILEFKSGAETAPVLARSVAVNFYEREIPDNAAVTAWSSAVQLTDIDIPTNEFFQKDSETLTLAALGLTAGAEHQILISRDTVDAGDTLVGDWKLEYIRVTFS